MFSLISERKAFRTHLAHVYLKLIKSKKVTENDSSSYALTFITRLLPSKTVFVVVGKS